MKPAFYIYTCLLISPLFAQRENAVEEFYSNTAKMITEFSDQLFLIKTKKQAEEFAAAFKTGMEKIKTLDQQFQKLNLTGKDVEKKLHKQLQRFTGAISTLHIDEEIAAVLGLPALRKPPARPTTKHPLIGKNAPAWKMDHWLNLNGAEKPSLKTLKGKVIYLYCFQSWCPACHTHGFPTLKRLSDHYQDDPNVRFIAIQTVFEGFKANTPENALKTADKFALKIPFAQSGGNRKRSHFMNDYKTRGTPWVIIIGPEGKVRFHSFNISIKEAIPLIDGLKK